MVKKLKEFTLSYAVKDGQILLPLKVKMHADFGSGLHNGVGGKVKNEPHWFAMIRENMEEQMILPIGFKRAGELYVSQPLKGELHDCHISLWLVNKFLGKATDTTEMQTAWFDLNNIPYDKMPNADSLWLPDLLAGKNPIIHIKRDDNTITDFHKELSL